MIDFTKLPEGNFMYVGFVRKPNGQFVGRDGVAFYGPARNMNGWLASVLTGHPSDTREIIVKKVMFIKENPETGGGKTPSVGLTEQVWIHLVVVPCKKGEIPKPEQANVKAGNRYYRVVELKGFDITECDQDNRGTVVMCQHKDADTIRTWLEESYVSRASKIEQAKKALAAAEEEADETSDNPI